MDMRSSLRPVVNTDGNAEFQLVDNEVRMTSYKAGNGKTPASQECLQPAQPRASRGGGHLPGTCPRSQPIKIIDRRTNSVSQCYFTELQL